MTVKAFILTVSLLFAGFSVHSNGDLIAKLYPYLSEINIESELIDELAVFAKKGSCEFSFSWTVAEKLHGYKITTWQAWNYIKMAKVNLCSAFRSLIEFDE